MASASEDEAASERCCGSYSPSADVSESETSSDCSAPTTRRFTSSSSASATVSRLASSSSSLPTPASAAAFYLSKPASDLSGEPPRPRPRLRRSHSKNLLSLLFLSSHSEFLFLPPYRFRGPEIDMMKERFAKLLLGEDMSGSGKGVCTALAISNAITNLSGTLPAGRGASP